MNFCTACGSSVEAVSQFCGNCGNKLIASGEVSSNEKSSPVANFTQSVEERAQRLIATVVNPQTTSELIDEILAEHEECFNAELCEICEFIEEEIYVDLLKAMATNPSLSPVQQSRIFSLGLESQGSIVGIISGFLKNPQISDEIKKNCLLAPDFISYHVDDDLADVLQGYLALMQANSSFSPEEIISFRAQCDAL